MLDNEKTVCGYVAIVGRPNVGKSTLLNYILGEKLSITSRKPQTTRQRVLGVKTLGFTQTIYVDTPGMHIGEKYALNRQMNKEARLALMDANAIVFVVDELKWTEEDELVFNTIKATNCPIILAVNKVDRVEDKTKLFPYLKTLSLKFPFFEVMPISVKQKTNIEALEKVITACLPKSPHYFPSDEITDRTLRFRMAEIIREKLVRFLGKELPYATTVEIEDYQKSGVNSVALLNAIIWVEREGQKPIVIGKEGERLKKIGTKARMDLERLLGSRLHLKLWVKVKAGWSNDERALKSLGYIEGDE